MHTWRINTGMTTTEICQETELEQCNASTEISHFVDCHLRPHVQLLPSYLKVTTDLLQKLDAHSTTVDLTSFYTNIPHEEACAEVLNTRLTQEPPTGD